jgi:hypothetical protein
LTLVPSVASEVLRFLRSAQTAQLLNLPANRSSTVRSFLSWGMSEADLDFVAALNASTRVLSNGITLGSSSGDGNSVGLSLLLLHLPARFRNTSHLHLSGSSRVRLLSQVPALYGEPPVALRVLRATSLELRMLEVASKPGALQTATTTAAVHESVRSRSFLRLLRLPPAVQDAIVRGAVTPAEAANLSARDANDRAALLALQKASSTKTRMPSSGEG